MNKSTGKFDKLISTLLIVMALVILLMVFIGDRTSPHVAMTYSDDFSAGAIWKFDFSRLMDRKSVEENFHIKPEVKGQFTWNGRTMYYQLDEGLNAGQSYVVELSSAAHSLDGKNFNEKWKKVIPTEPLQMAYLEAGKLITASIDGKTTNTYDLQDMSVKEMEYAHKANQIYLLAGKNADRPELWVYDLKDQQLKQLTDDSHYQNVNFHLSDDDKQIALSRIEVSNSGENLSRIEIWNAQTADWKFTKFDGGNAQGTDYGFSPQGKYLLFRNKDSNFELLGLGKDAERLFVGEFAQNFGFHPFQPKIAFAEYDQDDVFSLNNKLVIFSGEGGKKYLDFNGGIVRAAKFTPDGKSLIVLFSAAEDDLTPPDGFSQARRFHLYKVNLTTNEITKIVGDDDFSESNPIISRDSRYVLYQRVAALPEYLIDPAFELIQKQVGTIVPDKDVWLYDLKTGENKKIPVQADNIIFKP